MLIQCGGDGASHPLGQHAHQLILADDAELLALQSGRTADQPQQHTQPQPVQGKWQDQDQMLGGALLYLMEYRPGFIISMEKNNLFHLF